MTDELELPNAPQPVSLPSGGSDPLAAFRAPEMSDEEWAKERAEIEREVAETANPKPKAEKKPEKKNTKAVKAEEPEAEDDAPEPKATKAKTPEPESEPEAEAEEDMSELETALAALRRDGWTSEQLDKMGRKAILEMGKKRLKVQSDVDSKFADIEKLKAEIDRLQKAAPKEARPAPLEDNTAKKLDKIRELFGEEAASALAEILPKEAPQLDYEQKIQALQSQIVRFQVDQTRRDLAERFPEVLEPEKWQKVVEKAEKISPGYKDGEMFDLFADAAKLVGLKRQAQAKLDVNKTSNAKVNGSPSVNGRRTESLALDPEVAEYEAWKHLVKGGSSDEAVRIYRSGRM